MEFNIINRNPLISFGFFPKNNPKTQQKITYFFGSLCIRSLSFIPSLHSGIPDNLHLQDIFPVTSARRIVFRSESVTLTFSITSMNTSFFLWYMFGFLQEVSPVAWMVICFNLAMLFASCLSPPSKMYYFKTSVSIICGIP